MENTLEQIEAEKVKQNLKAFVSTLDGEGDGLNSPIDVLNGKNNNIPLGKTPEQLQEEEESNKKILEAEIEAEKIKQQGLVNQEKPNEENIEDDLTVIDFVKNNLGVEFKDVEGNDIVFENSFEGISDFVTKTSETLAKKYVDNILETKPEAKAFFDHVLAGGDVNSFKNNYIPDFGSVTLNKDNLDQLKNMFSQSLIAKGYSDEDVTGLIELAETKGNLLDKATQGQKELVKYREDFFVEQTKAKEQAELQAKQESENVVKEVKTIINSGKLLGIQLDKKSQDELLNYITKSIKNGFTQFEIDKDTKEKYSTEHELFEALQLMKGYQGILPKQVDKLKEVVQGSIPTKKNSSIPTSSSGKMVQKEEGKMPKLSTTDRDRILGLN